MELDGNAQENQKGGANSLFSEGVLDMPKVGVYI